jgi:hypothetical protein
MHSRIRKASPDIN